MGTGVWGMSCTPTGQAFGIPLQAGTSVSMGTHTSILYEWIKAG